MEGPPPPVAAATSISIDVAGFRAGETRAAERVFREYWPTLYRAAFRILMDHDEAEEAAQEAFVKGWNARGSFRGDSREALGAWLLAVTRRTALDHLRRRARTAPLADAEALASGADGPEAAAESRATCDEVRRALAALEPGDRAAIVLFEIEELPQAEIATGMGVSVNAFKVRLHRARRRFREAYIRIISTHKKVGDYHV
jgi:RNA polymerase sigma-70 factor (ECF subfamily)